MPARAEQARGHLARGTPGGEGTMTQLDQQRSVPTTRMRDLNLLLPLGPARP
jgi:hypothetical protein